MDDPRSIHEPVMVDEVVEALRPKDDAWIVDGTVGAGGHAERLLAATSSGRLLGVDRDREILQTARERLSPFRDRVQLHHARFDRVEEACRRVSMAVAHGILLDLGVSSLQLDRPERGFSFELDGPLDMRMDADVERTAADLVNRGTRDELVAAIRDLGEEPRWKAIVDAILEERERAPLLRTCELADLVRRIVPPGRRHHHPATRTFLGLRMSINEELPTIERALPALARLLAPGGRMAVIAFHSGEDRVVKRGLRSIAAQGLGRVLTHKPQTPRQSEIARNPRARSARLRVFERGFA